MPITADAARRNRIGTRTCGVALTLVAIVATLLFFIVYAGTSLNRAARDAERSLLNDALTEIVNRTLMEQKAWAFWDDGARAAQNSNLKRDWFDKQFAGPLIEGYGHDEIYLIGPDDRIRYGLGMRGRLPPSRLAALWPRIMPMLREIRTGEPRAYVRRDQPFALHQSRYAMLWGARSGRWAANVLDGGNGPVVVSLMTIVPTVDRSLITDRPNVMLSVVRLDKSAFDIIGGTRRLAGLRLLDKSAVRDGAVPLVTDEGSVAGALSWDVSAPGAVILDRVLPVLAILLAIATIYSGLIFRRLAEAHRKLASQEAQARQLSLEDPLSGLPNRRQFMIELEQRIAAIKSGEDDAEGFCVAYIDVDRFKDVNDAIGHGAGDALIAQIGPRLRAVLRPEDLLARLGGDEFAIVRALRRPNDPVRLGEAIMDAFKGPFDLLEDRQIEVTASVGIAAATGAACDPERLLAHADISLYRAKDLGRNRYVLFEAQMAEAVRKRHEIEIDLRAAIGSDQILVYYQPVISTRTGKVTAAEALVRWEHPRMGIIPPADFIPVAEESGLMVPLGDHILEKVFRELDHFEGIEIAVNLSPVQLRQRHLPKRLAQLLRLFDVDPRRIVLEVTETMLMEANETTTHVFEELRRLGFRIALDDFGTGFSSLSYLHQFEFDKIKIDRSFVTSSSLDRLRPIIEGIVHIGRGLRMDIVAEGVETAAEFAMVQAMGCSEAQGFWISHPLPLKEAAAFIGDPEAKPRDPPSALRVAHG